MGRHVDQQVNESVRHILHQVKARGDAAVLEFTEKFDRLVVSSVAELEMSSERSAGSDGDSGGSAGSAGEGRGQGALLSRETAPSWQYEDEDGTCWAEGNSAGPGRFVVPGVRRHILRQC